MRLLWSQRSAIAVSVLHKQLTPLPQHLVWLVFAHPPLPFCGQDRHIRRISTLTTLAGWTTEFHAHRAAFTVHAPARHLVSDTLFCRTLRPSVTGRGGPGFQY